jgi:hypothetical protein
LTCDFFFTEFASTAAGAGAGGGGAGGPGGGPPGGGAGRGGGEGPPPGGPSGFLLSSDRGSIGGPLPCGGVFPVGRVILFCLRMLEIEVDLHVPLVVRGLGEGIVTRQRMQRGIGMVLDFVDQRGIFMVVSEG